GPAWGRASMKLLDPQPGEHILDVGCGDGTLTLKIKEMGADVVGIDNSLSMVAAATAKGLGARLMGARAPKLSPARRPARPMPPTDIPRAKISPRSMSRPASRTLTPG